jgi:hypothetical protein
MAFPFGALIANIPGIVKAVSGLFSSKGEGEEWYPKEKVKASGQIGAAVIAIVFLLGQLGAPVEEFPTLVSSITAVAMFVAAWVKKEDGNA